MRVFLILCLFSTFQLFSQCEELELPLDRQETALIEALQEVDQYLAHVQEEGAPGLSAVVVYGKDILFGKGYGYADLKSKTPATIRTVYRVGGLTKVFTATMLMKLRDEGKVHLDTPVTDLMGSYAVRGCPGEGPPSLLQLAAHMAGLPVASQVDFWVDGDSLTEIDILKTLPGTSAILPLQKEAHYSHLGYVVLGHALSLAAEMPYSRYMWQKILQPLGMTDTAFELLPKIRPLLATGYVREQETLKPVTSHPWQGLEAAYGMMTSAHDLARFFAAQLGEAPDVLRPVSAREMQAPQFIYPGWRQAAGIGWFLFPQGPWTAVGHRGSAAGFYSEVEMIPSLKLGVAILTNGDRGKWWLGEPASRAGPETHAYRVLQILAPVVKMQRQRQLEQREQQKVEIDMAPFEGTYVPDGGRYYFKPIVIQAQRKKLVIWTDGALHKLVHLEGDKFRIDKRETLTFVRNETGDVTGLRLNSGGFFFRKSTPIKVGKSD